MIYVYAFFVFLLTTAVGSFLNVVIYRLPNKMSLANPSSHCPICNEQIKWYDNIPILSFIFLKGRCRYCKEKINPRYLVVELLTGIISTLIFFRFGISLNSLFGIILFLVLIPVSFIDIEHHYIPDVFQIILLVVGVVSIFFNDLAYTSSMAIGWKSKLIGFGISLIFSFFMIGIEYLIKKEIIGGGDLKLICVSSLFLGWQLTLLTVGISSILASIVELAFINARKKRNDALKEKIDRTEVEEDNIKGLFPFGPYLAISVVLSYVFGLNILEWWFSLIL